MGISTLLPAFTPQRRHEASTFPHEGCHRAMRTAASAKLRWERSATRLPGSDLRYRNPPLGAPGLPGPASGRELRADLLHPPLGRRSTCSVGPRSSHTTTSVRKADIDPELGEIFQTRQDGNHEPECSHVILRWTGHNHITVHLSLDWSS